MKTCVIKMLSGAEIVGRVKDPKLLNLAIVTVHDPLEIRYRENGMGYTAAAFMRYNYFGDTDTVQLATTAIESVYEIADVYQRAYEESVISIGKEMEQRREDMRNPRKEEEDDTTLANRLLAEIQRKASGNGSIH